MPLMEWNAKLGVGVRAIDDDHQKLVGMVNDLYDAMRTAQGKEVLGKVLDGLISYTKTHFAREEQLMAIHKYPQADAHHKEHVALATKVLEVQAKFKSGNTAILSMEVLNFLREWLIKHIQASDAALGAFLKSKNVAA